MAEKPNRKVSEPIAPEPVVPEPPILNDTEVRDRAIWLKAADGQRVHAWVEHGMLAVKGPGTPPVYIKASEKARLVALIDLPILPDRCAHGNTATECAACKQAGV